MSDTTILLEIIEMNGDCGELQCHKCPILDKPKSIPNELYKAHPCYNTDASLNTKFIRAIAINKLIKWYGDKKAKDMIVERLT